ncbi:MAG: hypothetical protein IJ141_00770 [Lachnospiraceae bacterium]|nr:hypothetical protein [Lachnospiraceae bacterium]
MNEAIYIPPISTKSANITLANGFLVIKGKHYRLRDWYIRKSSDNVAIPTKDILSIEFIKMRSKRALMLFVLFAMIFMSFGKILKRINENIPIILLVLCVITIFYYAFFTYRFCRITAMGNMIAVETKYYQREQLEQLIYCWNTMIYGM